MGEHTAVLVAAVIGVAVLMVMGMAAWSLLGRRRDDIEDPPLRPGEDMQWSTWPPVRSEAEAYRQAAARAAHTHERADRAPHHHPGSRRAEAHPQ